MKSFLFTILPVVLLISSCGITLEKRLYRNGFYVNTRSSPPVLPHCTPSVIPAADSSLQTQPDIVNVQAGDPFSSVPSFVYVSDVNTATVTGPADIPGKFFQEDTLRKPEVSPAPKPVEEEL